MAPQHKPLIVISTFPTPGHRADINHGAEKSASTAGSFVHLKFVSFPKQLPGLIRCFKKKKKRPFSGGGGWDTLLQSTLDKRPTGWPTWAETSGPNPSSPAAASQTPDRLAVTCCHHLLGTGAGQRGALRRAWPGSWSANTSSMLTYLPGLHPQNSEVLSLPHFTGEEPKAHNQ